jgi:polysaccharide biosynthesis protein PslH
MKKIKIILNEPYCGMNTGWPVRYVGLMKELAKYYQLSIYAPGDTRLLRDLFPGAWVCESTSATPLTIPFTIPGYLWSVLVPSHDAQYIPGFYYFPEFRALLQQDPGHYDASVYFRHNAVFGYGDIDATEVKFCDMGDSLLRHTMTRKQSSKGWRATLVNWIDIAYIHRIKRRLIPASVHLFTITQKDAESISRSLPLNLIFVVPNGTNLVRMEINDASIEKKYRSSTIIFLGAFDYEPNKTSLLFCLKEIWPDVLKKNPDLRFCIVGRRAPDSLRSELEKVRGVQFIGEVDDIYPYLVDAKVLLAPMFSGGGMKNKILESLSVGTPVVTNSEGATGIDLISGKHGFIAEDTDALIAAVEAAIAMPHERYAGCVRECIALAKQYSWDSMGLKLRSVIDGILK